MENDDVPARTLAAPIPATTVRRVTPVAEEIFVM
jgi:hypothetical protein